MMQNKHGSDNNELSAAEAKQKLEELFKNVTTKETKGPNYHPKLDDIYFDDEPTSEELEAKRLKSSGVSSMLTSASMASATSPAKPTRQQPISLFKKKTFSTRRVVYSSPKKNTGSRGPSEYRMRLERLRMAREDNEIIAAADTFLKYHQLPDESDILYKVLRHTNESICRNALGELSSLLMQGRLESHALLADHLKRLKGSCTEPATLSYIDGIDAQIKTMLD